MELSPIGYFSKTHGVKGQLILRTESDFEIEDLKVLFVEAAGAKAPYFLSDIKENNTGIIVSLEEIDAVEKAKLLVGKKVFIDTALVNEVEAEADLLGFELIDKQHGSLGNIISTSDNGHQVLISLNYKGKEVILPFVEEFIEKIDENEKKVFFNAPEGLIDVYLGDDQEN
ncbi:MAG: ribosome maturation factor RimM [Bacteroidota bacterium]